MLKIEDYLEQTMQRQDNVALVMNNSTFSIIVLRNTQYLYCAMYRHKKASWLTALTVGCDQSHWKDMNALVLLFRQGHSHCSALIFLCEPVKFDAVQTELLPSVAYDWFLIKDEYKYTAEFSLACDCCV